MRQSYIFFCEFFYFADRYDYEPLFERKSLPGIQKTFTLIRFYRMNVPFITLEYCPCRSHIQLGV